MSFLPWLIVSVIAGLLTACASAKVSGQNVKQTAGKIAADVASRVTGAGASRR